MNNKELNDVVFCYLQVCEAFRNSDNWSDKAKQAIDIYRQGGKFVAMQCPVISLSSPIEKCCNLLEEIRNGKNINKDVYKDVYNYANDIWCAYESTSLRDVFTYNNTFKVNMWVVEYLTNHFQLNEKIEINRDFFLLVNDKIIDELKKNIPS